MKMRKTLTKQAFTLLVILQFVMFALVIAMSSVHIKNMKWFIIVLIGLVIDTYILDKWGD